MSRIHVVRQRYHDRRGEHQRLLEQRQSFVRTRWLSRSDWYRRGYEIKEGATSVERSFRTPHGIQSFEAYHAFEVRIRNSVWQTMLERAGERLDTKPTLRNRRLVHRRLLDLGDTELADRLKRALVSASQYECDLTHLEWLEGKIAFELTEAQSCGEAYQTLLAPVLERRDITCSIRYLREKLAEMGVELPDSDLSIDQLEEHVGAAERALELRRLRGAFCAFGLDGNTLPADVNIRRLWSRLRHGGYLCTVPANAPVGVQVNELRERGKVTEAWLIVNMAARIEMQPCIHTDERTKTMFRQLNTKKYRKLRDLYDDWSATNSGDAVVVDPIAELMQRTSETEIAVQLLTEIEHGS